MKQPSLQQRIRNTWIATLVIMVLVFAFAAERFYRFEARLEQGDVVADLLRDSLEMRRHEKRYYVDGDRADLQAAAGFAHTSLARLSDDRASIEPNVRGDELAEFGQALRRYIDGLSRLEAAGAGAQAPEDTEAVRAAGSEVSALAKIWVQRERESLHASLARSRWQLAIVLLLAAGLVLVNFRWLARQVLLPLQRMVDRLAPIASGQFRQLTPRNDVVELHTLARAINHMLDVIEQRERKRAHTERLMALGVLVSGVAHELNNPLGNISSSLDLYEEQLRRPEGERDAARMQRYLRQARDETARAHRIVSLLLDHARERATERVDCAPTDLSRVVNRALRWSASHMRCENIRVDCPDGVVACVAREPLQQALVNLLRNADQVVGSEAAIAVRVTRRAAPDWNAPGRFSAGPLAIAAHGAPANGEAESVIAIEVADNGPGVRAEDMPHLFEPFYRSEPRRDTEGSGLGLYLAAQIMASHGGAISVENGADGGAVFTLWLPEERDGESTTPAG